MKRIAVLDLGTNTFNLLIVELTGEKSYKILVNRKLPVKLGEGKISTGEIPESALKRGLSAIKQHYLIISEYHVKVVKAFGTSALRTAKNGKEFLKEINNIIGVDVEIISGEREADLIYKGVKQTFDLGSRKFLILDIGGGSNELIIADSDNIIWKKSYPLGIARLLEKFHPDDPISSDQILEIKNYLKEQTQDLFEAVRKNNIDTLIGASGSFESFVSLIKKLDVEETGGLLEPQAEPITINEFNNLYDLLIRSTVYDRGKMKGLETMRIEMIVLACLFVKFILENHDFKQIIQSNFALKEGAILELLTD